MATKAISIRIFGKVQGVYFRQSTQHKAMELGLQGKVSNLPDGSVYVEAMGEEQALAQLVEWCHKGPMLAHVDKVEVRT